MSYVTVNIICNVTYYSSFGVMFGETENNFTLTNSSLILNMTVANNSNSGYGVSTMIGYGYDTLTLNNVSVKFS